ncbi:MAG: multicopper oxidase family protein [Gemmatimonadaceae bacterium]|nr:multicopper oxidase family protein [Gemmatimonadaceae bacterium]
MFIVMKAIARSQAVESLAKGRGAVQRGHRVPFIVVLTSLAVLDVAPARASAQSPPRGEPLCPAGIAPFASPLCAELVPTPDLLGVTGMLELRAVRSPFGVAVTADGRLRHRLVARIAGLPAPSSLGDYGAYVAWGYDVTMAGERRLGVVRDGEFDLGELPWERFRVVVSAERSSSATARRGRLVLRATSPAALLLAHRDAMGAMNAGAASPASPTASPTESPHVEHAHHAGGWPAPPNDARIAPAPMAHPPPSTAPWRPDTAGAEVREASARRLVDLRDGDTLRLTAGFVRRTIGSRTFVMYGYNGQYPGPLIRVRQGAEVVVRFLNAIDLPSTIHWHGLRLDNRFDGVPGVTQAPVAPGDSFTYRLRFPDAGIYWYHPHVREDIQQELGLYGNLLVMRRARSRVPVHREEILALDDFLAGSEGAYPFGADAPSHALMGRFGNLLLVNGEPSYRLQLPTGSVVRFYLTNVANARIFNLRIPGARLKLVGADLGDLEREEWVESVVIAPAERYIVEARFDAPGEYAMVNAVQWLDHMRGSVRPAVDTMGMITVGRTAAHPDLGASFATLRSNRDVQEEIAPFRRFFDRPVDHTLTLGMRTTGLSPAMVAMLVGVAVPLDWNDAMPMMNAPLSGKDVTWTLTDERGRENMDIHWRFRVGDVVRIRLRNDPAVTHAMAHPIHFHGQRFLVASRNGVPNDNLVWKDTAVLPAGETMELILELSNPGDWMFHCHIAEHLGTGMMGLMTVTR